jgi:hypothetical protein
MADEGKTESLQQDPGDRFDDGDGVGASYPFLQISEKCYRSDVARRLYVPTIYRVPRLIRVYSGEIFAGYEMNVQMREAQASS